MFFTHRTTQRLYATQLQKLQVPPVQEKCTIFARTCIPARSPKRQFYRNLKCFLHICNNQTKPQTRPHTNPTYLWNNPTTPPKTPQNGFEMARYDHPKTPNYQTKPQTRPHTSPTYLWNNPTTPPKTPQNELQRTCPPVGFDILWKNVSSIALQAAFELFWQYLQCFLHIAQHKGCMPHNSKNFKCLPCSKNALFSHELVSQQDLPRGNFIVIYSIFCIFATTKLKPTPNPIPGQHTSEIIQQHLQRHPKMNLNEPAPPVGFEIPWKNGSSIAAFLTVFTVFCTHRTTQRLYATQLQKLQVPPVQEKWTCILAKSPKRQFYRNLKCFLHICNNQTKPQTRPHTSPTYLWNNPTTPPKTPQMGLKMPNMTPLKPQTTKLNPKPDPIPAQHTSEKIQQHLQRHPKMNFNEPAPPLALTFFEKMFPALLCRLLLNSFDSIYSVFYTSHNTKAVCNTTPKTSSASRAAKMHYFRTNLYPSKISQEAILS